MSAHRIASPHAFNAFAEQYLVNELTIEQILSIPGVANLVLEQYHNCIVDEFDEKHDGETSEEIAAHYIGAET